jgi:[ribosomal protein S5]-alanine N-acetyltransferase
VSFAELAAPIRTSRLDLVLLPRAWLDAYVAGGRLPDLGFDDPHLVLTGSEGLVRMRAEQLAADPAQEPWLLRMMVLRTGARGEAIGYANFHAPPDDRGMVEIGYRVEAHLRGQGFASEAAAAMWDWAHRHGARVLRASIAPDNAASIALVRRAGFLRVGEQIDDVDGLEIIWERELVPPPDR